MTRANAGYYQRADRRPLTRGTVLVVEGRDLWEFVRALLQELGLLDRVDVRDGGGVADLSDYVRTLPSVSGFDAVTYLGLIRDCEHDPAGAFASACGLLRAAGLAVPAKPLEPTVPPLVPRVAVMLLPDASSPGMLETLCWRALAEDSRVPCVEQFLRCVEAQTGRPIARLEKSRVYAYIACREEPWFQLGQAAWTNYFPWTSPAFDELKLFLQALTSAS